MCLLATFSVGFIFGTYMDSKDNSIFPYDFYGTFSTENDNELVNNYSNLYYISISEEDLSYIVFCVENEEIYAQGKCTINENIVLLSRNDSLSGSVVFSNKKYYWIDNSMGLIPIVKISPAPTYPSES